MTGPNLTPFWDRWRRKRRTKYLRAGATPSQAESGSRLEAQGRQRIEKTAGRRVALAAEFGLIPGRDGSETLGFWIDPALIDPLERDAAYVALGVHAMALPTSLLYPGGA
ncbi:hypothetical protein [Celeribacter baekdonensis]|uniref:hypothetical protein n=1 Tax=Celeribacter baekdonensis TaxID=875171 RepID=UPI0030DBDF46|tara:strand:- start:251632 stop:251961 length:330 start_codon:yes stop_codon:yes gene_type:complete